MIEIKVHESLDTVYRSKVSAREGVALRVEERSENGKRQNKLEKDSFNALFT